jgi:hypothetical protein
MDRSTSWNEELVNVKHQKERFGADALQSIARV